MIRWFSILGVSAIICSACAGPSWTSSLTANSRQVALALNDPVEVGSTAPFDPRSVPDFPAPAKLRPCCAFGMDLKAEIGAMRVPGYENGNIAGIEDLGPHGYGDGPTGEHNALVYTCRGGFIDVAHIRDNADRMLYLATQVVRALPGAVAVELPDEGTKRRLVVKALPAGMLDHEGRWRIATTIAEWANFQFSVWHEIATWYGWESVKGFSEKVSAFSPEDLYSNVLGERIAAGILANREIRSRDAYNQAMDAWIAEALRRLGAVSRERGRAAMKAVDGQWWDSTKALPDSKLVTRRYLDLGPSLDPWLVEEAISEPDPALKNMCPRHLPPLTLETPQRIGNHKIEDLASVELEVTDWAPRDFPIPLVKGKMLTQADFRAIVAGIRRAGAEEMGADFDQPYPPGRADKARAKAATTK